MDIKNIARCFISSLFIEYSANMEVSSENIIKCGVVLNTSLKPTPLNITNIKGFVDAIIECYNHHRPLYIDPKTVWVTIVHQVYLLINYNERKMRDKFVRFNGKMNLHVIANVFDLVDAIHENIEDKDFKDWIIAEFSTSSEKDVTVLKAMMMGIFKKYFNYLVSDCAYTCKLI
ncbi:hypothetical protein [Trichoplusia ni ascovirus 2c]|uniref:hypothetical protein n=1 Tax=Trichoplusia ni ascovirus 2c TaxID=328615 RepID=UPI0000E441E6|nr:hypothetical protein TNAV2c_gp014 [Trichoplusia ni ascovirus 2c]ABF70531.1 hypothetical protein [Trichoplusia ni ascovirus 2c]